MLQNRCDVHTHTFFSRHAYSTVRENVLAARDAGLELLGVTDHFSDMLFPGADLTHADLRDYQYFINTTTWPRTWEGVRLLHGAEADIRTLDGRLFGQDFLGGSFTFIRGHVDRGVCFLQGGYYAYIVQRRFVVCADRPVCVRLFYCMDVQFR